MQKAVYPGSFDPVTYGHLDIIERASFLFDEVIVGVIANPRKIPAFTMEERKEMLEKVTKKFKNVKIELFSGLLVDFVKSQGARVIIRGLRAISDFEYEMQLAFTNRSLAHDVETMFLLTNMNYAYINSGLVKEIASLGGRLEDLVPEEIIPYLKKRFPKE